MPNRMKTENDLARNMDALRHDMTQFKDDVVGLLSTLVETGKAKGSALTERVSDGVSDRLDQVRAGLKKVKRHGRDAARHAERKVSDHPLASLALALGAGWLVGRFFRRRGRAA